MRIALTVALLAGLLLSPLAAAQGERACDMAANASPTGPVLTCKACCADAMPCCELSKRETSQPQPQPLSNEQGHSHRQALSAPILTFLPLFWSLPPPSGVLLRHQERNVVAFSRVPRAAVSCIWLI